MNSRLSIWPVWVGFLLSLVALISFPAFFVRFPVTRDFPWGNLLLIAIAVPLLLIGLRRAFGNGSTRSRKIVSSVVATLSVIVCALFVFGYFVFGRQLPASHESPKVGQKAPEFSLPDTQGKTVALSELLKTPVNGQAPKGVLLVFYRGYW